MHCYGISATLIYRSVITTHLNFMRLQHHCRCPRSELDFTHYALDLMEHNNDNLVSRRWRWVPIQEILNSSKSALLQYDRKQSNLWYMCGMIQCRRGACSAHEHTSAWFQYKLAIVHMMSYVYRIEGRMLNCWFNGEATPQKHCSRTDPSHC